jgi:general nucleoside transport system permease protein
MADTIEILLGGTVLLMTPIFLAALGEIISERAGVLNIGIEGVMLSGAFVAAGALQLGLSLTVAVLIAVPAGVLIGLILSYLFVFRAVDQVVGGILFNIMVLGGTTLLFVSYFDAGKRSGIYADIAVPGLSSLPVVGPALFDQPALVYLTILLVLGLHYLLMRTWFGLHVRAVGERPEAVDTAGVSVSSVRTAALTIGCALIALGGASLVVLSAGGFTPGMTEGRGFIGLAIAMLARWNPLMAIPAAAGFGLAGAFQFHAQALDLTSVPAQFWAMLPYIVAIFAVAFGRTARYPAGIAVPYVRQ